MIFPYVIVLPCTADLLETEMVLDELTPINGIPFLNHLNGFVVFSLPSKTKCSLGMINTLKCMKHSSHKSHLRTKQLLGGQCDEVC